MDCHHIEQGQLTLNYNTHQLYDDTNGKITRGMIENSYHQYYIHDLDMYDGK